MDYHSCNGRKRFYIGGSVVKGSRCFNEVEFVGWCGVWYGVVWPISSVVRAAFL